MNNRLSDGTIIPSTLSTTNDFKSMTALTGNTTLKLGYVTRIYFPEDKGNLSKTNIEYDVSVEEKFGLSSTNISTYRNCYVNNIFGGATDHIDFTHKLNTEVEDIKKNNGDLVLLLCLNGHSLGGSNIILGALSQDKKKYKKEDGHFYDFSFNGIKWNIDKDGQTTIAFTGAEDATGKKVDATNTGTKLFIDKKGRFSIVDRENQTLSMDVIIGLITLGNGESSIQISKFYKFIKQSSAGKFSLDSKEEMQLNSSKTLELMGKLDVTVESMASVSIRAKQNATFKSDARVQIQAGADMTITAGAKVTIQAAATAQIMGTITLLGQGTNPVALAGVSQCLGFNAGGPVVSTIITGSTSVLAGT